MKRRLEPCSYLEEEDSRQNTPEDCVKTQKKDLFLSLVGSFNIIQQILRKMDPLSSKPHNECVACLCPHGGQVWCAQNSSQLNLTIMALITGWISKFIQLRTEVSGLSHSYGDEDLFYCLCKNKYANLPFLIIRKSWFWRENKIIC